MKRLIAVLFALMGLFFMNVPHASADVCSTCNGGAVYNWSSSSGPLRISNNSTAIYLYPGKSSTSYTYYQDVDWFLTPRCAAQRYYNGAWTTVYQPNIWYYVADADSLSIRVSWC